MSETQATFADIDAPAADDSDRFAAVRDDQRALTNYDNPADVPTRDAPPAGWDVAARRGPGTRDAWALRGESVRVAVVAVHGPDGLEYEIHAADVDRPNPGRVAAEADTHEGARTAARETMRRLGGVDS